MGTTTSTVKVVFLGESASAIKASQDVETGLVGVSTAAKNAGVSVAGAAKGAVVGITGIQSRLREVEAGFARAGQQADAKLFGAMQGKSAQIEIELAKMTAQGGVTAQALIADFERVVASEEAARVELARYDAQLARTQTRAASGIGVRGDAQAQTARSQLRNVLTGRAGMGSLDAAALGRFALGGLAVGAVFQGLQHLSSGLKVTGDEAATTEGKLRNLGASLVTGDVVGGIIALTKNADSADESLRKLLATEGTSTVDIRNFAIVTRDSARANEEFAHETEGAGAAAARGGGRFAGAGQAAARTAAELRATASEAEHLARAFDTSAQAAADVESAIAAAGSETARFGEQARGTGGIAARNAAPGAGATFTDQSNTSDTANSVAESMAARTKTLQDDLAVAQREAAAAAGLEKRQQGVVEDAAKRHLDTVAAETRVAQIQSQIDEQAAAAAKAAADKATKARNDFISNWVAAAQERVTKAQLAGGTGLKTLQAEETGLRGLIVKYRGDADVRQQLEQQLLSVIAGETSIKSDAAANAKALADARNKKLADTVNGILAGFDEKKTLAQIAGGTGLKVLQEEEAKLRGLIVKYRGHAEIRRQLESSLLSVMTEEKGIKPATPAQDFAKLSFAFLQTLHGVQNQSAGNTLDPSGRQLVHYTREQTEHLAAIRAAGRNPEARYDRYSAERMMQGGF